jgi:hypothetical protein
VPAVHVVQPGEHLAAIATRFGFENFLHIWEDPNNAELKALRGTPALLAPGDQLFIPDRVQIVFSRSTASSHDFQANLDRVGFHLRLLDLAFKPRTGTDVEITVEAPSGTGDASVQPTQKLTTDGDGKVTVRIAKSATVAGVVVKGLQYAGEMKIGALDPIDTPTGVAQRLTNLGYIVPLPEQDAKPDVAKETFDYDLRSAAEEFQCDQGINPPNPDPMSAALKAKLKQVYGA